MKGGANELVVANDLAVVAVGRHHVPHLLKRRDAHRVLQVWLRAPDMGLLVDHLIGLGIQQPLHTKMDSTAQMSFGPDSFKFRA